MATAAYFIWTHRNIAWQSGANGRLAVLLVGLISPEILLACSVSPLSRVVVVVGVTARPSPLRQTSQLVSSGMPCTRHHG
jgi:hypothetical protein